MDRRRIKANYNVQWFIDVMRCYTCGWEHFGDIESSLMRGNIQDELVAWAQEQHDLMQIMEPAVPKCTRRKLTIKFSRVAWE